MNETTDITLPVLAVVSKIPGALFWRQNSGTFLSLDGARHVRATSINGTADIMGVYNGRAVAIETKTRAGKMLKSQRNFRAAFEAAGGLYLVINSPNEVLYAFLTA